MQRTIIRIDDSKCDGCGLCVDACHEGAIQLVNGRARLVSATYCDGLGACLGECPQGAISMEEREAEPFLGPAPGAPAAGGRDDREVPRAEAPAPGGAHSAAHAAREAFQRAMARAPNPHEGHAVSGGCPGSALRDLRPPNPATISAPPGLFGAGAGIEASPVPDAPRLSHWPVQLMLVPPGAPFLKGAHLVVCADCVPFAVPDFHARYLDGRSIVVGCPKLDDLEHYREKLKAIVAEAGPASLTVVRMEVPCCGGIARAVTDARDAAAPGLPVAVHTVGIRGGISRQTL